MIYMRQIQWNFIEIKKVQTDKCTLRRAQVRLGNRDRHMPLDLFVCKQNQNVQGVQSEKKWDCI